MLKLIQPTSGKVYIDGDDIFSLSPKQLKAIRQKIQVVFQDPIASLNPRLRVGESIEEGLIIHKIGTRRSRKDMISEALLNVGLEEGHASRYPHEFSGGQRQRIGIARALVLKPKFIVLDEPISALDVSIQAEILNILKDLQEQYNLTYLFIAHNLAVVEHISNRVAVMYLGKIVELAPNDELFTHQLHPYTQALVSAIPVPDPTKQRDRIILKGDVPSPLNPPSGCNFHPRCPIANLDRCSVEKPEQREILPDHFVACHYAERFVD
jgi:peptide/nickel transport system ATP-binding protein/oligopeptide transport system ATP-binding protein